MNALSHATKRMQMRCIPPVVHSWLDQFGDEAYDGHGGVCVFFSRESVRRMERALGRHFVRQNRKYLQAYRIDSSHDSAVITTGWRTKHLHRR
jgi:hypothetical protein